LSLRDFNPGEDKFACPQLLALNMKLEFEEESGDSKHQTPRYQMQADAWSRLLAYRRVWHAPRVHPIHLQVSPEPQSTCSLSQGAWPFSPGSPRPAFLCSVLVSQLTCTGNDHILVSKLGWIPEVTRNEAQAHHGVNIQSETRAELARAKSKLLVSTAPPWAEET
jgi:hypothetical protein